MAGTHRQCTNKIFSARASIHTFPSTLSHTQSILRDAVTDLALHYLAKAKIMVVRDIERSDIEFISKTLGCLPIAHGDHMKPEKVRGRWR